MIFFKTNPDIYMLDICQTISDGNAFLISRGGVLGARIAFGIVVLGTYCVVRDIEV